MPTIAPDADLLTVPEAAAVLKVSPVTVSRWLRQGRLPAYRLGPRAVRIRRADLAAVVSPARERSSVGASGGARLADAAIEPIGGGTPETVDADARLAALAAAASLRDQILARRKGTPLPPLDGDRKRGKRG